MTFITGSTLQSDYNSSDGSSKDSTYCAKEDSRIADFLPQVPDDSPTKTGLQSQTLSVLTEKSQISQVVSPEKTLNKSKRKSLTSGKNNLSNDKDLSVYHKSKEDEGLFNKDNLSQDSDAHSSVGKENVTPESSEYSSLSTEHSSEHSSPGKKNDTPELSGQSLSGTENSMSESMGGLTSSSKYHLSVSQKSVHGQQHEETSDTEIHHSSAVKEGSNNDLSEEDVNEGSNDLSEKEEDQEIPEYQGQGRQNQELLNSKNESQELSSEVGEDYQESLSGLSMQQSSLHDQQGESLQDNLQALRSEVKCSVLDLESVTSGKSFIKQDLSECQDHTKLSTESENITSSTNKSIRNYDKSPEPLIPSSSLADKLLNKSNKKESEVSTNRTDNSKSLPESSLSDNTTHNTETGTEIPHTETNDDIYTEQKNKTHNTTTRKSFVFPDLSFDSQDSVMMVDDDNDSVKNKSLENKSMRKRTKSMITVDNSVLDEFASEGKTYRKSTGSMMIGKNNKQKQGKKGKQKQKDTAENIEVMKNSTKQKDNDNQQLSNDKLENTEVSNISSYKQKLSLNEINEDLKIHKQLKVTKKSKGKSTNHSVTNTDTSLGLNDSNEHLKKDKQSKTAKKSKNRSVKNTDIHDSSTDGTTETNKEDSQVKTKTTKGKKGRKAAAGNKKYGLRSRKKSVGNKSSDVITNESENTLNKLTTDIDIPLEESVEAKHDTCQR